jgi:hypothetical protein
MSMCCGVFCISPDELKRLADEPEFIEDLTGTGSKAPSVWLEKAWHGLHYLLTGDAWESESPLGFIAGGGTPVEGSDLGYGEARAFTPAEVQKIDGQLSQVSGDALWSRFDAPAMTEAGIYPLIWDEGEEQLREEYLGYFDDLKGFIRKTAADGQCLLVSIA